MVAVRKPKTDELAAGPNLQCPQAVAVAPNLFDTAIHQGVGLVVGERGREMLHHDGVGVERGERSRSCSRHWRRASRAVEGSVNGVAMEQRVPVG